MIKRGAPRLITPNRNQQVLMRHTDVERLIPEDHPARAIWEFVGRLDLEPYERKIKSVEGNPGRPAFDPRLLISIWILAISEKVGTAREIEALCEYHPAFQWLTGMEEINHHTLSDFRMDHKEELDDLFTEILGHLGAVNLITLERVTQDGSKIKACASKSSFHREATIRAHLEAARQQVKDAGDPCHDHGDAHREKARQSVVDNRNTRLENALSELHKIRSTKKSEEDRKEARVSETDPEARIMKQGDGGLAPSYNVQLSVDGAHGIIVNVDVTQSVTDNAELMPAMEEIERRTGEKPKQVIADGGYTNHANIMSMARAEIDFVGSFKDSSAMVDAQYARRGIAPEFRNENFQYDAAKDSYQCPAGEELKYVSVDTRRPGTIQYMYRANVNACQACKHRAKCHPGEKLQGRSLMRIQELTPVIAYHEKMKTDEAKAAYQTRSQTAEFPNAWFKDKFGFRQFHVRGKAKAKQEALWAGLTYNIQQWIRLIWKPGLEPSHA